MSTDLFRNYLDIINENSKPKVQLDEGVMDILTPYIKKAANALMSKLDPQTMQGLKQALDQSGGDIAQYIFYIASAALIWGVGHYDFSDIDKGAPKLPGNTGM